MKNSLLVLFLILAAMLISYLVYRANTEAVFTRDSTSSISIEADPVQTADKETILPPMQIGRNKYFFTVKAGYQISGLLVGKRYYRQGHWGRLSPYDYSLVWGNMPSYLPHLKFSNAFRFCLYKHKQNVILDNKYIESHVSNNHIIPSNQNIRHALKTVRKGNLVRIDGYLVNVTANVKGKGTSNWNTSTVRTDTGNGACEIVYVAKLQINDRIYE